MEGVYLEDVCSNLKGIGRKVRTGMMVDRGKSVLTIRKAEEIGKQVNNLKK